MNSRILGFLLLIGSLTIFSALLIKGVISLPLFIALATSWIIVSLVIIFGPETITEIRSKHLAIKRDLKAAKEIRKEIESTKNELRQLAKRIVETSYINASNSFAAMGGEKKSRTKLEGALDELSQFAEPDDEKRDEWWEELHGLFEERRNR